MEFVMIVEPDEVGRKDLRQFSRQKSLLFLIRLQGDRRRHWIY